MCLPPNNAPEYAAAVSQYARGDSKDVRIMLEKPIGVDLASAEEIEKELLAAGIAKTELYLVDHYLGKPMVHMMTEQGFRGSADILSAKYFDKSVVVIQKEARDLDGRVASFFEGVGQVRDLTQSHLLQMLAVAALPPGQIDVSEEKANILKRTVLVDDVAGQYNGYIDQLVSETAAKGWKKVDKHQLKVGTSTYSRMRFKVENDRWDGVPFFIETGKALDSSNSVVRYEAKSGCNLIVNMWGQPRATQGPTSWLMLENPDSCDEKVKSFLANVKSHYNGTALDGNENKIEVIPTQGGLPAYANIFASVASGRRDQCIDFQQVRAQWRSVADHLDLPLKDVKCYEKCEPCMSCPALGECPVCPVCPALGECKVTGVSVDDLVNARTLARGSVGSDGKISIA